MIKYYESLLLYEKSILVILEAVYSSRFIKVLRPYLDVTRVPLKMAFKLNFTQRYFIYTLHCTFLTYYFPIRYDIFLCKKEKFVSKFAFVKNKTYRYVYCITFYIAIPTLGIFIHNLFVLSSTILYNLSASYKR